MWATSPFGSPVQYRAKVPRISLISGPPWMRGPVGRCAGRVELSTAATRHPLESGFFMRDAERVSPRAVLVGRTIGGRQRIVRLFPVGFAGVLKCKNFASMPSPIFHPTYAAVPTALELGPLSFPSSRWSASDDGWLGIGRCSDSHRSLQTLVQLTFGMPDPRRRCCVTSSRSCGLYTYADPVAGL